MKTNDKHYYPVYQLNPKNFFANFDIDQKTFPKNSEIAAIITNIVGGNKIEINLKLISQFGQIKKKFINVHNKCYGVLLVLPSNKLVYVPIKLGDINVDNLCDYDIFDPNAYDLSIKVLDGFLGLLRKKVRVDIDYILNYDDKFIGYEASIDGSKYNFHFTKIPTFNTNYNVKYLRYEIFEVNKLLMKRALNIKSDHLKGRDEMASIGFYENNLYKLFFIEFIHLLNKERNDNLRDKLRELIKNINKAREKFTEQLNAILPDFSDDIIKINRQIAENFPNIKLMLKNFDKDTYNFDKITLHKFLTLPKEQLIMELKKFMQDNIKLGRPEKMSFINIFFPCQISTEQDYCAKGKLIVPDDEFNNLIEILADDVLNPLKNKYLDSLVENVANFYAFKKYPNEQIFIRKV